MSKRREEWIDDDEYPDDRDVERYGDDSVGDYDPLTIGRMRGVRSPYWTRSRMIVAAIAFLLLLGFVIFRILPVFTQ